MPIERLARVAGAAAVAGVLVLTAIGYRHDDQRRALVAAEATRINSLPRPAVTVQQPLVALFVGDSYASGAAGVQIPNTFPCITAALLSWECRVDGAGGTGYMTSIVVDGEKRPEYMGRLGMDKRRWRPDVVVVTAGRNDGANPGIGAASLAYFEQARKTFPNAKLVVVTPFWVNDEPPAFMVATRKAISRSAEKVGATVIDSDGWLWDDLIADGVHPDAYGHQMIAKRLAPELAKAVGVKMPPLPIGWPQNPENDGT